MPGHVPAAALWVVSDAGLLAASEIFSRNDKKPVNLASLESEGSREEEARQRADWWRGSVAGWL